MNFHVSKNKIEERKFTGREAEEKGDWEKMSGGIQEEEREKPEKWWIMTAWLINMSSCKVG